MEYLRERLVKLRKEKKLSQREVAEAVFVSRSIVAKWENGLLSPKHADLDALNKFYKLLDNPLILDEENDKIRATPSIVHYTKEDFMKKFLKHIILATVLIAGAILLLLLALLHNDWEDKFHTTSNSFYTSDYKCEISTQGVFVSYIGDDDYVEIPSHIYWKPKGWNMHHSFTVYGIDLSSFNEKDIVIPKTVSEVYFSGETTIRSVSISKYNPVFDSRDNCNCIIESSNNTVLYIAPNGFIPTTSTRVIFSYVLTNNFQLLIPATIKKIEGYKRKDSLQYIWVEATYDAFNKALEYENRFYDYNKEITYYYSESAPTSNIVKYWHYDENHNPVKW